LALFYICAISFPLSAETDPYRFIDEKSQEMVNVIVTNSDLFASDPTAFKQKIKDIFESMVDFRRVGAMVMGRTYYKNASFEQRNEFIEVFKSSLLLVRKSSFIYPIYGPHTKCEEIGVPHGLR